MKDTSNQLKSKLGLGEFNIKSPTTFCLTPSQNDYKNGYIKRYFVGNVNYINIQEVNLKQYDNINSFFYKRVKINWKLTGERNNVYENNILKSVGVYEYNTISINDAKKVIVGLERLISDPLQFWRGF